MEINFLRVDLYRRKSLMRSASPTWEQRWYEQMWQSFYVHFSRFTCVHCRDRDYLEYLHQGVKWIEFFLRQSWWTRLYGAKFAARERWLECLHGFAHAHSHATTTGNDSTMYIQRAISCASIGMNLYTSHRLPLCCCHYECDCCSPVDGESV